MIIDFRIRLNDEVVSNGVFSAPDEATYEQIDDISSEILESSVFIEWKYQDEEDKELNWR